MIDRWFARMALWAHRPPSLTRVMIWVVVAALCFAIAGYEHFFGWPDWLRVNGRLRP